MKFDFKNKAVGGFNFELARGLSAVDVGSAQIGECFETMERIRDGDFESWIASWSATAGQLIRRSCSGNSLPEPTRSYRITA